MSVRIATFNVENLFRRPSAMNLESWAEGKPIIDDYARFSRIMAKDIYSVADKRWMATFLVKYNLHTRSAAQAKYFCLNEVRGKLFKVPKGTQTPEIIVQGR